MLGKFSEVPKHKADDIKECYYGYMIASTRLEAMYIISYVISINEHRYNKVEVQPDRQISLSLSNKKANDKSTY